MDEFSLERKGICRVRVRVGVGITREANLRYPGIVQ